GLQVSPRSLEEGNRVLVVPSRHQQLGSLERVGEGALRELAEGGDQGVTDQLLVVAQLGRELRRAMPLLGAGKRLHRPRAVSRAESFLRYALGISQQGVQCALVNHRGDPFSLAPSKSLPFCGASARMEKE